MEMKKLLLVSLIFMILAVTNAYSTTHVESGSNILMTPSNQAIYAFNEELEIEVFVKEVVTEYFQVENEVSTLVKTETARTFEGLEHNLNMRNNSNEMVECVIVDNPFEYIDINKLNYLKSKTKKNFEVSISEDARVHDFMRLTEEDTVQFRVESQDKLAIIKAPVRLKSKVDSEYKTVVTVIEPEVINPDGIEEEVIASSEE